VDIRRLWARASSTTMPKSDRRLADRVLAQVEPHHGTGRPLIKVEPVRLESVNGKDVTMGLAGRRTRAAVTGLAQVGHALDCVRWEIRGAPITFRNACGRGWDVEHDPLPPAAAGRGIGIVDRNREALGPLRSPAPRQSGRMVRSRAAETVENLLVGHERVWLEVIDLQAEVRRRHRAGQDGERERGEMVILGNDPPGPELSRSGCIRTDRKSRADPCV
jgi:hypothetical protein